MRKSELFFINYYADFDRTFNLCRPQSTRYDYLVKPICLWRTGSRILWVIVLGIYWDKANAYGALSSMIIGLGVISCSLNLA